MLLALKSNFVATAGFCYIEQCIQNSLTYSFFSIIWVGNDIFNMSHFSASNFYFKYNGAVPHNIFINNCHY